MGGREMELRGEDAPAWRTGHQFGSAWKKVAVMEEAV